MWIDAGPTTEGVPLDGEVKVTVGRRGSSTYNAEDEIGVSDTGTRILLRLLGFLRKLRRHSSKLDTIPGNEFPLS